MSKDTGVATTRNLEQGIAPTEQEKSEGKVIGFRQMTDLEKTKNAFATMERHIQMMSEYQDNITSILYDEEKANG